MELLPGSIRISTNLQHISGRQLALSGVDIDGCAPPAIARPVVIIHQPILTVGLHVLHQLGGVLEELHEHEVLVGIIEHKLPLR